MPQYFSKQNYYRPAPLSNSLQPILTPHPEFEPTTVVDKGGALIGSAKYPDSIAFSITLLTDNRPPSLFFTVNPKQISYKQNKSITNQHTRNGWTSEFWGDLPMEITVSGQTGGTYVEYGQTNGGLVGGARCGDKADARLDSAAYQELRTLLLFYKNNGRNYYSGIQTIKRTKSTFQPPPLGIPQPGSGSSNTTSNIVVTGSSFPANQQPPPEVVTAVNAAAEDYGVDPNVMLAIIWNESVPKWNTKSINDTGEDRKRGNAWGMGQMTLVTARGLFENDSKLQQKYPRFVDTPITGPDILNDIQLQADLTAALLRENMNRSPNNLPAAISAYNNGPQGIFTDSYHTNVLKYLQYQTLQSPPPVDTVTPSLPFPISLLAPAVSPTTVNASVLYNARRIRTVGHVMIAFDGVNYLGHFNSFEFFDTADHPYWFEYLFTFTALQVFKGKFTTKDLYQLGHATFGGI